MEQRRLRLGDILDDYCPRERRVTNHAVVAMIEEDVKQTRCTTCDAEHAYKGGREPKRRKKDTTAVLYREVLAGMPDADVSSVTRREDAPPLAAAVAADDDGLLDPDLPADDEEIHADAEEGDEELDTAPAEDEVLAEVPEPERPAETDEGFFHRRLIRATLPRPEGQKIERQAPDFTLRNNGSFRGDRARGQGANGNGAGHRGRRFAGGQGSGGGGGQQQGRGGNRGGRQGFGASGGANRGPRKRSR